MQRSSRSIALLACATLSAATAAAQDRWPDWRGPGKDGVAHTALALPWSQDDLAWVVDVPGRACSTPVVWDGTVFLTTAVPLAATPTPGEDQAEFHGGGGPQAPHSFRVLALDLATGEERWSRVATEGTPHEGFHRTYGSHASSSPVTDGERLVVSFGSQGIFCFDLAGDLLWSFSLPAPLSMRRQFGGGGVLALDGDTLLVNADQEGPSALLALDVATGELRWSVARDEPSTWATPLVTEVDGRREVVASGTNAVRGYDLETGEELWSCAGLGLNAIPNPLRFADHVLVMSGYRDQNRMAIALGRRGDLTGTDAVLWQGTDGTAYTPSPALAGDVYVSLTDRGFLSAFDAGTGEPLYVEQRLPRGMTFKASPLVVGDALVCQAETGEAAVLSAGRSFELRAEVPAPALADGELFLASPVAVQGRLLLRSTARLFCYAPGATPEAPADDSR